VAGTAVLVVALVGIVVNLAATLTLSKANRESMNIEGSYQHMLTDLVAFIVTAIAGAENNCHATRRHLEAILPDQFEIEHTTLQVDHDGGELLDIELPEHHQHVTR
jgi:Co/Zn/Cd efflux system component